MPLTSTILENILPVFHILRSAGLLYICHVQQINYSKSASQSKKQKTISSSDRQKIVKYSNSNKTGLATKSS